MHRSRFISLSDNTFDRFTIVHFWNYVSYSDDTVRSNVLTFHFTVIYICIYIYFFIFLLVFFFQTVYCFHFNVLFVNILRHLSPIDVGIQIVSDTF